MCLDLGGRLGDLVELATDPSTRRLQVAPSAKPADDRVDRAGDEAGDRNPKGKPEDEHAPMVDQAAVGRQPGAIIDARRGVEQPGSSPGS